MGPRGLQRGELHLDQRHLRVHPPHRLCPRQERQCGGRRHFIHFVANLAADTAAVATPDLAPDGNPDGASDRSTVASAHASANGGSDVAAEGHPDAATFAATLSLRLSPTLAVGLDAAGKRRCLVPSSRRVSRRRSADMCRSLTQESSHPGRCST